MVAVVVGDRDAAGAAARLDLGGDGVEVLVDLRARVDDPGGVAPDHPRVRARQRVGPGVLRPDADDVQAVQLVDAHRGTSR